MTDPLNLLAAAGPRPHWTPHDCAGGLLAVKEPRAGGAPIGRRDVLKGAAAGAATLALSAIGTARSAPADSIPPPAPEPATASPTAPVGAAVASPAPAGLVGYAFNAKTQDVTLFDPVTQQVIATKPLGAVVRWLSNEQRFWDGRQIWTYDFPNDAVHAIAIDPRAVSVARMLPADGRGPAHSLMLTPDRTEAWVNVAGDDVLAVFDVATGQVAAKIETGAFPWDLHFTPDGRFGFVPERDQDTVSKFELATRRIVKTVAFPPGSKPYMLRVSPDGTVVWVQTSGANTNAALDVDTMETVWTTPTGRGPVQSAFGPADGRYGLVTHLDEPFVLALDRRTGREAQRIDVGGPQANASFTPDGATAYVTVTSPGEVVAIDMTELVVVGRIGTGGEPMGLVVFDPATA